jgi:hypothetical protein
MKLQASKTNVNCLNNAKQKATMGLSHRLSGYFPVDAVAPNYYAYSTVTHLFILSKNDTSQTHVILESRHVSLFVTGVSYTVIPCFTDKYAVQMKTQWINQN